MLNRFFVPRLQLTYPIKIKLTDFVAAELEVAGNGALGVRESEA